jgi:hypothetical protein
MIRAFENDLININILVDVGAIGKKKRNCHTRAWKRTVSQVSA